uniref:Uncharacterized protein n=1 Tax=Ananas comosus var. bracteatus TaxID=296719 RepID=A0A6V7NGV5_ANACO|nr:unnamed protein product [Ananas comosus var. bracteatus]
MPYRYPMPRTQPDSCTLDHTGEFRYLTPVPVVDARGSDKRSNRKGIVAKGLRKATGFGCCAFRRPGSRQGRRELEPYPTDRARAIPAAGTVVASYTGKIPLYMADLSACPGNETSGA